LLPKQCTTAYRQINYSWQPQS